MKTISLPKGFCALVDDDVYEALLQFNWRILTTAKRTTYAVTAGRSPAGKWFTLQMAYLVLGIWPRKGYEIDHIDRNGLNNQRSNLRLCECWQNAVNRRTRHGSSRFRGVYHKPGKDRWMAKITARGHSFRLGTYKSEVEAARAYNEAAITHHGEFAQLNVLPDPADDLVIGKLEPAARDVELLRDELHGFRKELTETMAMFRAYLKRKIG
jgi:hypothetical protein